MLKNDFCGSLFCLYDRISNKLWSARHLKTLFLLLATLHVSARVFSQKVNMHLENTTLKNAFQVIRQQTGYSFLWDQQLLDKAPRLSVDIHDADVQTALNICLKNLSLTYSISGKVIYIKAKAATVSTASFMESAMAESRRNEVKGRVTDSTGAALGGVSVHLVGTAKGTTTDEDGSFRIVANDGDILEFSYTGYTTQRVSVSGSSLNVTLKYKVAVLNDVVVVAFGTQRKYAMTTAVVQVNNSVLQNRPIADPIAGLQGQVAGVNISQQSGAPGAAPNIVIRGAGSIQSGTNPLVIIDGIAGTMANMANIAPNDIESISVLKDAAASSLYGARAANGVVLITTKKGKVGKMAVSYQGYIGWQKPSELFKEADAYHYSTAYNYGLNYDAIAPANTAIASQGKDVFSQTQLDGWKNGTLPTTDWRKALFDGNNGVMNSHYLDITGGVSNEKITLRNNLSLGYFQQNGNIVNTSYTRYTVRNNTEMSWGKFAAGLSVGLSTTKTDQPNSKNIGGLNNIISAINKQRPMDEIKVDGTYVPTTSKDTNNPVGEAEMGGSTKAKTNNVLVNLHASYSLMRNLVLKVTGGLNYTGLTQKTFLNSTTFYNANTGLTLTNGSNSATNFFTSDYHYMGQVDLTYNTNWGKNHFGFVVGGQEEYEQYNDYTMTGGNFLNNSSSSMQLADPTTFNSSSNQYEWGLIGAFGRFNYDYDKKYLFEFDIRDDGSSRLSPDKRWNIFPSVSTGWRISEEKFWAPLKNALPEFKLRGSYGILGNDQLPGTNYNQLYYRDASLIGNVANAINNGQYVTFDGTAFVPMALIQNPNNNITWEKTAITDIAIDGAIGNYDLSYSIDYFNKKTTGMLMTEQLSNVNGAGSYVANVGSMENYGIEFQLNYNHTTAYGLKYMLSGNYSFLNSKVLDLGGQGYAQVSNQAGYVLNPFYLYTNDGLLTKTEYETQTPNNAKDPLLKGQKWGDQRILDINGDGVINGSDRTVINKNRIPKDLFGFNFDFSYKGFGLAGMIQGAANYYQYLGGSVGYGFNSGYSISNWTINNSYNPLVNEDNYNARLPRVSIANTINNQYPSTMFLFNSSYARLKNLQVYYEFPKSILDKIKINHARLYVSGQNLFTITSLPKELGIDPEVGTSTGSNTPGITNPNTGSATGSYPLLKTWTVGLNVAF